MKKILLSVVCLLVVGMQSVVAQTAICALHHAGSVKIYGQPSLQNAIDAVAKKKGLTIVINKNSAATGGTDITQEVVEGLAEEKK